MLKKEIFSLTYLRRFNLYLLISGVHLLDKIYYTLKNLFFFCYIDRRLVASQLSLEIKEAKVSDVILGMIFCLIYIHLCKYTYIGFIQREANESLLRFWGRCQVMK